MFAVMLASSNVNERAVTLLTVCTEPCALLVSITDIDDMFQTAESVVSIISSRSKSECI